MIKYKVLALLLFLILLTLSCNSDKKNDILVNQTNNRDSIFVYGTSELTHYLKNIETGDLIVVDKKLYCSKILKISKKKLNNFQADFSKDFSGKVNFGTFYRLNNQIPDDHKTTDVFVNETGISVVYDGINESEIEKEKSTNCKEELPLEKTFLEKFQ